MTSFFRNSGPVTFGLLATVLIAINGCTVDPASRDTPDQRTSLETPMPTSASLSGNFLAGRFAQRQQDWSSASTYMNQAMSFDENNALLGQRVFLLSLGAGDHDRAEKLAREVLKTAPSQEMALIFLACDAMAKTDYTAAMDWASKLPDQGFGQYTKPVITAWALAGLGKNDEAIALLAKHQQPDEPTFDLHAALIEERAGKIDDADQHFRAVAGKGLTMQTALIAAKFYERHDGGAKARQIYDSLGKAYPFNPFVSAIAKPGSSSADAFASPADGVAIGLFEIANALYDRRAYDSAQIYARLVERVNPQSSSARLLMGDVAALHGDEKTALGHYQAIAQNSPVYWLAQTRMADMFEAEGKMAEAEQLLITLSASPEMKDQALVALGDFYRRTSQFGKAVSAYDRVLATADKEDSSYWAVVYARGMSLEKTDNWQRAEKDLMTALDMQPENPMILNFIGYSWLEKGINTERALDYTRKAASLRPTDGYIVDSYGLALYRTRNFDEAVIALERAATLIPDDTDILNHLGDAYWQVGRKQEARYKWQRAIDMTTDARIKSSLARKMQDGIEQVPTAQVTQSDKNL